MKKYILTIDQGTTSTRAILFNQSGQIVHSAFKDVKCLYPSPSYVETDALELWLSVLAVVNEVLITANVSLEDVDGIGITNQRETTIVWDKVTGMPVYNAIVWQSRQSAAYCDALEAKKEFIFNKTGLLINPYFSASKIRYILDHIKDGQGRAERGELLFGTVDSWIIYKLTNGRVHATDISNASRTLLFNIFDRQWDSDLLALFNIPSVMLPKVFPSSHTFGHCEFLKVPVPIAGVAGDQQASLFGHLCLDKGDSKNTYGTGCFMLMNIGSKPCLAKGGLLTTVAWQIGNKVTYAFEGSVFVGGAAVQWLRDEMQLIRTAKYSEKEASKACKNDGVYVVPAFVGLGTPYWDDKARGAVFGLTRATSKSEFIRATLESIAYQTKDVFAVMEEASKIDLKRLQVDGGATSNGYLMQFQADLLDCQIRVAKIMETTSLGVLFLAGLETGFFSSINEIKKLKYEGTIYKPKMTSDVRDQLYRGWKKAVKATQSFSQE
jgi:glycerol kinase